MFYKETINEICTKLDLYKITLNNNITDIQQLEINNQTALELIEGHDKLLQKLILTINKHNNQIKKLEENYQLLVKVCKKIVTKIDPEWESKTVKINTSKKGK